MTGNPAAAASRARIAPDERPNRPADPPTSSIRAARSSISRSTAYGAVSPLSPRPRRSYAIAVAPGASAAARAAAVARSLKAPPTMMIGWPSPDRSYAMTVPSREIALCTGFCCGVSDVSDMGFPRSSDRVPLY
nr:hypothetical protein [Rhodococcus sp. MTM3W5.2]